MLPPGFAPGGRRLETDTAIEPSSGRRDPLDKRRWNTGEREQNWGTRLGFASPGICTRKLLHLKQTALLICPGKRASGRRELHPRQGLGRAACCCYTTPADSGSRGSHPGIWNGAPEGELSPRPQGKTELSKSGGRGWRRTLARRRRLPRASLFGSLLRPTHQPIRRPRGALSSPARKSWTLRDATPSPFAPTRL